jgi:hypothetical protein
VCGCGCVFSVLVCFLHTSRMIRLGMSLLVPSIDNRVHNYATRTNCVCTNEDNTWDRWRTLIRREIRYTRDTSSEKKTKIDRKTEREREGSTSIDDDDDDDACVRRACVHPVMMIDDPLARFISSSRSWKKSSS